MQLRYTPARPEDYEAMERLMYREAGDLGETLRRIGLSPEALARRLRTVGSVHAVFADGARAGFVWIEKRDRVGRRVLARLERLYGDEVDAIELGAQLSNHRTRKLYAAAGFTLAQTREDLGFAILRKRMKPGDPIPGP